MNVDELMAVWRTQDTAPLHDVNKTLLRQALLQDEITLQQARRRERRILYAASAFVISLLAVLLTLMIHVRQRDTLTDWDYAVGMGGATAALLAGLAIYAGHRTQARREQGFGESLRDRLNRHIAQVDDAVTGARRRSTILVLMGVICPMAILHLGMRINGKSIGNTSPIIVILLICCLWFGAIGLRRSVDRATSRKQRLEGLLKELDEQ